MDSTPKGLVPAHPFPTSEREAVYRAILNRRDVRGQFLPDPLSDQLLSRLLIAAHHAPSVGFMQPWTFMVVREHAVKRRVHELFVKANAEAALLFPENQRDVYRSLKLEGITEAPVNLCITCDRRRAGRVVIGRTHIPIMDLYSVVCAVQNLWLAARAEGLGVGWVSIFDQRLLRQTLGIPTGIVPIAYLCLGHVSGFHAKPELETAGWRPRLPLDELIRFDGWSGPTADEPLLERVREDQQAVAEGRFIPNQQA